MTLQTAAAPSPQHLGGGGSPFLTTAEAAAIIRTDTEYVARQCANKHLVAKKVGKEWRIHRDDLDAFMRAGVSGAKAPPARSRSRAAGPSTGTRKRAK